MKTSCVWIACAAAIAVIAPSAVLGAERMLPPASEPRIVGGVEATPFEFPWLGALLTSSNFQFCGGSLIASNVFLTAAHCVVDSTTGAVSSPSSIRVALRRHDLGATESNAEVIDVSSISVHPNYASASTFDVALLQLATASTVSPATAATSDATVGSSLTAAGWGLTTENGVSSTVLRKVDLNVFSNTDCSQIENFAVPDEIVCAGVSGGGKDSCQGDSGGPLFSGTTVFGVVSSGVGCARPDHLGLYVRLSEASVASFISTTTASLASSAASAATAAPTTAATAAATTIPTPTAAAATTTTTTTTTGTSTNSGGSSDSLSDGAVAGIAVGGVAFLGVVGGLVYVMASGSSGAAAAPPPQMRSANVGGGGDEGSLDSSASSSSSSYSSDSGSSYDSDYSDYSYA